MDILDLKAQEAVWRRANPAIRPFEDRESGAHTPCVAAHAAPMPAVPAPALTAPALTAPAAPMPAVTPPTVTPHAVTPPTVTPPTVTPHAAPMPAAQTAADRAARLRILHRLELCYLSLARQLPGKGAALRSLAGSVAREKHGLRCLGDGEQSAVVPALSKTPVGRDALTQLRLLERDEKRLAGLEQLIRDPL